MTALNLPSDSSITIDGVTIHANASVILLWQKVIRRAIESGHVRWVQIDNGDRVQSVLVHSGTSVSSVLARSDVSENAPELLGSKATNSNLAAWVDLYFEKDDPSWDLARAIGLDTEIRANHAADNPSKEA